MSGERTHRFIQEAKDWLLLRANCEAKTPAERRNCLHYEAGEADCCHFENHEDQRHCRSILGYIHHIALEIEARRWRERRKREGK